MAQTVREMLIELAALQQTESWLTAQAFAEFKQAEALQTISEVLRVGVTKPVAMNATTQAAVDDMKALQGKRR